MSEGAARLERAGMLEELELQGEGSPGQAEVRSAHLEHRRLANIRADGRLVLGDVVTGDQCGAFFGVYRLWGSDSGTLR